MVRKAFDNDLYLKIQSEHILDRIKQFDNKLYLEFGGKLFDDYHASRVLPGFMPDSKIQMFQEIKSKTEFIVVTSSSDIKTNKIRNDNEITYENEVFRLIKTFKSYGIKTGSVVVTRYEADPRVDAFMVKLSNMGYPVYKHYRIDQYPYATDLILSEDGFGKNEFVETTKPLVLVTAPGPGSGKMATCLSQLYNELKRGVKAGYAKFETFPIWNLPLQHPVNLAYESATADLADVNMIDPYHLAAYGVQTVNYNRDIEVFPVLRAIFERIYGTSPYQSPTDMGVNMIASCIIDDEAAIEASKEEVIRRYLDAQVRVKNGKYDKSVLNKLLIIMNQLGIDVSYRKCVEAAHQKKEKTNKNSMAMELNDGTIITGKQSKILSAASACLINALKHIADIPHKIELLPSSMLEPIIDLKTAKFDKNDSCLKVSEVLIVLSVSAQTNPLAKAALEKLDDLNGVQCHSTVMLDYGEEVFLKRWNIGVTMDAEID